MGSWHVTDDDESLSWLLGVASDVDVAGHDIGPLPEKVWVLHPLFERIDRGPLDDLSVDLSPGGATVFVDDEDRFRYEALPLTWREYSTRRGRQLNCRRGWPGWDDLPGVWFDGSVTPPSEGEIADDRTRSAVYETLLDHSDVGPDTMCTAWWYDFWVDEDASGRRPNVLRGPLGAWRELYERDDRVLGLQNLWPDNHTWVLATHTDSWATGISGPSALVAALQAHPQLETLRFGADP